MADIFRAHPDEEGFFWSNRRYLIAAVVVAALGLSACLVLVNPGEAVVITRFGNPVRVTTSPGLAFKLPPPIENAVVVDLRLRTTSSGLHDVGTRDGLRILVQAYIAWQVPDDADHIRQFLRAVRNQPAIAAEQLRSFTGSALEIAASSFDLADLVNTEPSKIKLDQFENALHQRIDDQALRVYGITVRQVGLERLTLPAQTLNATIERMKAERDTVAAERSAEGERAAAQIQSDANRDSRVLIAKANADAADIEAKSRIEAAGIYKKAYAGDPQLYTLLRSLDSLDQVIGPNTRLILRTDAAPFRVLVEGPGGTVPTKGGKMTSAEDLREEMKDVGPLGQAVALAFRFLFVAACLIAAGWFVSNFRQVPPDSQAVVMRFGAVARIQGSGLLMALPRPIEQIVILPAPARQIPLRIERFVEGTAAGPGEGYDLSRDPRANGGFLLTGDSNVVHLEAQLFYQVSDPVAYMIAQAHVRPALQRLFIAGAIRVVGRRNLDSILVARPEIAAQASEAAERERFRADLVNETNKRLAALAQSDASLGISVSRVDLVPSIPAGAKEGFDNVLTVSQSADTAVAQARTAAQFTSQGANSKKDHIATDAAATAEEIVTNAKAQTASIAALAEQSKDMSRSMLMTRYFYDRIQPILKKAGGIDVVDKDGAVHTILPGVFAAPNRRANQ